MQSEKINHDLAALERGHDDVVLNERPFVREWLEAEASRPDVSERLFGCLKIAELNARPRQQAGRFRCIDLAEFEDALPRIHQVTLTDAHGVVPSFPATIVKC